MTTVMLCYMTCYDCGLLSAWASFPVVWCHIFIALVAAQRGTDGPFVTWGCAGPESPNPPGGTSCWWSGPGGKNQSKGLLLFGDLQSSPLGYVKILGNQMKPAWNPNKYLCISLQNELPISLGPAGVHAKFCLGVSNLFTGYLNHTKHHAFLGLVVNTREY